MGGLLSSKPFVIATVGSSHWQSKAVVGSSETCWGDEDVEDFFVMDQHAQVLRIVVRDAEYGGYGAGALKASDFLGRTELHITELISGMNGGRPCECWCDLEDDEGSCGQLLLRAQWRSFCRQRDLETTAALPV